MTLHTYPDVEQRSPEWFDQRLGMITASAVGQLITPTLRVADNDTSRGLTATLVSERITGHSEPTRMTDDMFRGVLHEPYAIEAYEKHTKATVQPCGFMVFDGDGWQLGFSPDGLVGDDGLVEVKCPRAKGHLATILSGNVPARHMAQLQAGLLVSGRKWIDFISFHGGLPLFVKRVYPDPAWFEAITNAVAQFERNAAELTDKYLAAAVGLPATERPPALEEGIF